MMNSMGMPLSQRLLQAIAVVATALALLWPAYVNGGPFWFPDTSTYIRGADAATVFVTGSPSEWSDRLTIAEPAAPATTAQGAGTAASTPAQAVQAPPLRPTRPVLTGRSIYYGFLLYAPMRMLGPWGAVLLQALLVAGLLLFCGSIILRQLPAMERKWPIAALGVLIALTPLPFYTAMLMPDVFSGLLILILATSIVLWRHLSLAEKSVLIGSAAVIATFHTTHMLIAAAMAVGGAAIQFAFSTGKRAIWRPIAVVLPVLATGLAASAAFTMSVAHALDTEPFSPPFLSARLTAAGPGAEFLQRDCAADPDAWALCEHRARLPRISDTFLWSENAQGGAVFQVAGLQAQARMAREDKRFFAAVLADDPFALIGVSLTSFASQLVSFNLLNFNPPVVSHADLVDKYPEAIARDIAQSRAGQRTMPTAFTVWASIATTLGSVIFLAWLALRVARDGKGLSNNQWRLLVLILFGVIANAAICGALSGPHARYQMRLVWLVPFVTMAVAAALGRAAEPHRRIEGNQAEHAA